MRRDVVSVRLWLPRVRVLGVVVDAPERLVADARAMTVNAAARRHALSWRLANALVVAWAGLVAGRRRRQRCRVLVVDGDLDPRTAPVRDGAGEPRRRRGARHGAPPQRPGAVGGFGCSGAQMVPWREGRGVRRLGGVQGSHRSAPRPRPPCAGQVPRDQMVRRRASQQCAATCSAAPRAPSRRSTPKCSGRGSC